MEEGFWLQYASNYADEFVSFADDLAVDGYRPGVVFAPVGAPARLSRLFAKARAQGAAFLDPSGFLIDRAPSPQRENNFPWLDVSYGRPNDVDGWTPWMEQSLEHQLSQDLRQGATAPTIVVTPSPQLSAAVGMEELYAIVDAATAARDSTAGESECWIGIAVDRDYLREEARLTELANALVTAGFPGVVFRCFQGELAPVTDRRLLEGLRELVEGCAGGDVGIFLPNAGWMGFLTLAWGATGFSGGLSKGSWFDRMPTPMTNPGRRETIFERQLLRHVRWTLHEQLLGEDGYEGCACRSCVAQDGRYDANEAKLHQIRVAHEWSDDLRALNLVARRHFIRGLLVSATDFRDSLPRTLRDRTEANFLNTWLSLV
jgi:hypothetical protein